jgi:hypothetical protein
MTIVIFGKNTYGNESRGIQGQMFEGHGAG